VYKGKLVCEGPSTSLKARFGDNYIIRSESDVEADTMIWRTTNSAEATRKLLELETLTEDNTYNVVFPTLEQVFLKVTSESHTAIHDHGGDGIVGEEENATVIDEKIFALETEAARDIDLEVGHSTGLIRQVATIFRKRYLLLQQKSGWIAYGINTIIPIIIAAALVKFFYRFSPLQTCAVNDQILRNAMIGKSSQAAGYPVIAPLEQWNRPAIYEGYEGSPAIILGPQSDFTGPAEDALYSTDISPYFQTFYGSTSNESTSELSLTSRVFVNSTADMISSITDASDSGFAGFGIFAPTPDSAIIYYYSFVDDYDSGNSMLAMNLITDRIVASTPGTSGGKTATATTRTMRTPADIINFTSMPIAILLGLAFITAASIAIIYPAFEKNNRVRALQYCNGVSPFALWFGYLLFDMQFILIQSLIVWGLLFVGRPGDFWYAPNYILGVFILFGIATYLGVYLLSLITKKAAFAIAAGIHVLLFVLYIVSYVMNQSFGNVGNLYSTYSYIQYGLGLSSPGANLARALFVASNSFGVLCDKYGTADISTPFSYDRYGGVYTNLLIQIIFLIAVLSLYEYGSADWIRRNITHRGMPARLHYIVDSGDAPTQPPIPSEAEKNVTARAAAPPTEILTVSRLSKYFGKLFAVENISFDISANQTLALLGGNGAGKTTVINMIRGELKPNFGDIYLDGISVLKQPHKARLQMGVCPQDDAIDNLTVRQTLNFYATVKGLKNVELNVDKVLNALNITIYEHVSVKDLSGGTRRKLSVAIALLGKRFRSKPF
jgi:ATP-binding cassette subfamily A (ABC1) protein 3